MRNTKYIILPEEILAAGFNLEPLGISEIAWKSQTAIAVIDFLFSKGYPILGGDVYTYINDTAKTTSSSWYLNERDSDNYLLESRNKAIAYISSFRALNGEKYIYSVTF